MGKKNKGGGGGDVELTRVNKDKGSPDVKSAQISKKAHQNKKSATSSGRNGEGDFDYYSEYFDDEMLRDIIADCPDINITGSLYSKPDCHKCMCDVLQDVLQDAGFEECTWWLDVRLLLSIIACGIGVYTVGWLQFPAHKDVLFYLVVVYAFITGIVTYIDVSALGPSNVFSLRDDENRSVHVSVGMEENSSEVFLDVRSSRDGGAPTVRSACISRYFDEEGYLVLEPLFNDLLKTIETHCGHLPIRGKKCLASGEVREPAASSTPSKSDKKKN
eukprot:g19107.t1